MTAEHQKIVFLTLIVGRKQKDTLLPALAEAGGRIINTVYGHGSVKAGYLSDMLGFVPEQNKVLITCLLPSGKADEMLDTLNDKFGFNEPNTGIAFTVPVDKLAF